MNIDQKRAYEWAKTHDYPSIAARHARALAEAVDELKAERDNASESGLYWAEQCAKQAEVIKQLREKLLSSNGPQDGKGDGAE